MKSDTFLIILSILALIFAGGGEAFASDLEIVEEARDIRTPQEALSTPQRPDETKPAAQPTIVRADEEPAVKTDKKIMPPPPAVPSQEIGEPTRYTLGPDDSIEIIVRRHGEFSGTYAINAEGKIQYKFVGDVEIKGLTKTEVKEKIAQILRKFIINPEVDVSILEYRSKVIYVIGEVGAPGKYYMRADKVSLREAVVQAGLPTLAASMRKTQLIRPDKSGKPMEKKVDLYALLYEGKLNLDMEMLPGDVLVVPATLFAKIARIINPVAAPVMTSDTLRRTATGGI